MEVFTSEKLTQLIELILNPVSDGRVEIDRSTMNPDEVKIRFKSYNREQICDPYWPWIGSQKEYLTALSIAANKIQK